MLDRKLNIAIVTNEFPSLTETFVTTKVLQLHKRGHNITVIKNQDSGQVNSSHLALVKEAGIQLLSYNAISTVAQLAKAAAKNPATFLHSFSVKRREFKRKYKQRLQLKLLQTQSFDIIHFEFSGLAISYINAIEQLKTKTVVSCRGTAEKVKPISQPARKAQLQKLFSVVDAIHCVSADMMGTIKPYCNNEKKVFVNRPSIDTKIFKRSNAYTKSNAPLHILTIGRFTFQKGYLIGLIAMRSLKTQGILFTWKIVGDGPQHEEIMYHIHALQLEDCVELVGKKSRDEIIDLYNTTDIFLLPSVYEGIANVCLEAMAMELTVVATKSGGMEEVIEHDVDGLLCEVYDPEDIAKQLLVVANDYDKRKCLGLYAREKVVKTFTIQHQAAVFEEQYYKLLKHNN